MRITTEQQSHSILLHLSGKIDALTCVALEEVLKGVLEAGNKQIILEMNDVPYISSAGLRVILMGAKRLFGEGSLSLCSPKKNVRGIFEMAGFHNILDIYDHRDEIRDPNPIHG